MTFFLYSANDVACPRDCLLSADWLNQVLAVQSKNQTSCSTVERIDQCQWEELAFLKTIDLIPVHSSGNWELVLKKGNETFKSPPDPEKVAVCKGEQNNIKVMVAKTYAQE